MAKAQLLENFFDVSAKIKRQMAQGIQDKDGLATFFQLQVLSYLSNHTDSTPGQLAEAFCMSSSAVAQLIDRLLTSKWVARIHDENDRRVVHLRLTQEGEGELNRLKDIRRKRLVPLVKHLDEKDLQELIRILQKVHMSMDKELERKTNGKY
jgi:DNA-binding MarR family transcriptional regulator